MLFIEPVLLVTSCVQGTDAYDQAFQVRVSGNVEANFTLSANVDWISMTPPGGTVSGDRTDVTVHFKTASFALGEYDGIITLFSGDTDVTNSPQTIPVHVSVKSEAGGGRGGGSGGGCFIISTSTEDDSGIQGIPFIVLVGMGFWGMILLTPRGSGNRYRG
jgi:hypothetical protein